jgi:hypothetical protein
MMHGQQNFKRAITVWGNFDTKTFHDSCCSLNVIRMVKSNMMEGGESCDLYGTDQSPMGYDAVTLGEYFLKQSEDNSGLNAGP